MTTPHLIDDLKRDEGCRLVAYPDPLSPRGKYLALKPKDRPVGWPNGAAALDGSPWTIGYGHTGADVLSTTRWTQAEADLTLEHDVADVCEELDARLPWWRKLSDLRQDVLANMAFNMGVKRLLGFQRMLALARAGEYDKASLAMLDSLWADELAAHANDNQPSRPQRLAAQMKTGLRAA